MNHYFIENRELEDRVKTFDYSINFVSFKFTSNSGMFSPGHVDPATDILLKNIPKLSGSLLDMGCGYGVIGIVLAKLYDLELTMADVNGRALEYAAKNCKDNNVRAEIIKSDSFENIHRTFNNIVLNPPIHAGKKTVFNMYDGSCEHLVLNGKLYVIIQEKHGAKSSIKKLMSLFGNCEIIYKKSGYYVLECTVL